MGKLAEIHQALKALQDAPAVQVWPALVKSVQGATCTVDIVGTQLVDLDGVKLRADDEASEGVLIKPRVGSFVYVGCIENEVSNLFICQYSEIDQVQIVLEGVTVLMDKDGLSAKKGNIELTLKDAATIKQAEAEMTLKDGKVTIKNAGANLKDLFSDLTTLLKSFKVLCGPAGSPSTTVFPDSLASIAQVEAKVNQLLQ